MSLNNEIKGKIIDEGHYTEANYPFTIKPNFSTLRSIIKISTQGPVITFVPDDSMKDLLGFNKKTIFEEYNLPLNPVDILSFDKTYFECDIAQGMIYKGKDLEKFIISQWILIQGINTLKKSEVVFNGTLWKVRIIFQVFVLS